MDLSFTEVEIHREKYVYPTKRNAQPPTFQNKTNLDGGNIDSIGARGEATS